MKHNGDARNYLEGRGYYLLSSYFWTHPTVSNPTADEWEAIEYLMEAANYDGFIEFAALTPDQCDDSEWEVLNEQVQQQSKQQHDQANETTDGTHA